MRDILDRGLDGVALLEYIKPYILDNSMKLLLGNHELFAIMYLNGVLGEKYTDKVLDERTLVLCQDLAQNKMRSSVS